MRFGAKEVPREEYLKLLKDIQDQTGIAIIFITHDFGIVERICDRVAVMYAGKIVELAPTQELFQEQLHPYTKALLYAIPIQDPRVNARHIHLKGEVPSLITPPSGCRFHPRCSKCDGVSCSETEPVLKEVKKNHFVACYQY